MENSSINPSSDFLADFAEHADFLRDLARSLIRDEQRAEDLVQEAREAFLDLPISADVEPRPWLARVVRNLASNMRRSEGRRRLREIAVARPEAEELGSIPDRLEVQRRLVELVAQLDEAQRTTVYLRFYEGLPPREIAERLSVPVSSVKTRLSRALDRLRENLDSSFDGERHAWCVALAPMADLVTEARRAGTLLQIGTLAVSIKLVSAVALTLVAVVGWNTWFEPETAAPATLASPRSVSSEVALNEATPPIDKTASATRVELVPEPAQPTVSTDSTAPSIHSLTVLVTDLEGANLEGAEVRAHFTLTDSWESAKTNSSGEAKFELPSPSALSRHSQMSVEATAELRGFLPQRRYAPGITLGEADDLQLSLELEPGSLALGVVVDAEGERVSNAQIAAVDEFGFSQGSAKSREDGSFVLPLKSETTEFRVVAVEEAKGWGLGESFTNESSEGLGVEILTGSVQLHHGASIGGFVRFPDGSPVPRIKLQYLRQGPLDESESPSDVRIAEFDWARWMLSLTQAQAPGFPALRGRASGFAFTDDEGQFTIAGLIPGLYSFSFPTLRSRDERAAYGPFATTDLVEVILQEPRLLVRVIDQEGLPVPGAELILDSGSSSTFTRASGLEATNEFGVWPGTWTIVANAEGTLPVEATLTVVPERFVYDVTLTLDFNPDVGGLRVQLADDLGRSIRDFEVQLFDLPREPGGKSPVWPVVHGIDPDADGFLPLIPVGVYIARVRSHYIDAADWFQVEEQVVIAKGETTELAVTTHRGARLLLDLRAGLEKLSTDHGYVNVAVELFDLYGERVAKIVTLFRPTEKGYVSTNTTNGEHGVSQLFEAGSYVVRFTAAGYETLEVTVNLAAGLTFELSPKLIHQ